MARLIMHRTRNLGVVGVGGAYTVGPFINRDNNAVTTPEGGDGGATPEGGDGGQVEGETKVTATKVEAGE